MEQQRTNLYARCTDEGSVGWVPFEYSNEFLGSQEERSLFMDLPETHSIQQRKDSSGITIYRRLRYKDIEYFVPAITINHVREQLIAVGIPITVIHNIQAPMYSSCIIREGNTAVSRWTFFNTYTVPIRWKLSELHLVWEDGHDVVSANIVTTEVVDTMGKKKLIVSAIVSYDGDTAGIREARNMYITDTGDDLQIYT